MDAPINDSLAVRATLCADIDMMAARYREMTLPALRAYVAALGSTAQAYDIQPLAGIARAFERSIALHREDAAFSLYFDQLKMAVGCEAADSETARDAMLAAISVRFAG
ncbi:MAG: hypothetical protein H7X93_01120 [Sphingomonadaceae bacterium]|nr:hypothetical protein [Sphingomonadaceae bacterium]